ncbi:MAG TPA: glycosyltransferase family 4 protein [Candidatus Acidoferrum sp.]|nr:glycosyltransferase family 4 protein [Candidatus Acidoferrum sp.]
MQGLQEFRAQEFARREASLKGAARQKLVQGERRRGPLHIVYVMTHVGVCGGTKIILEHANHLTRHGQRVTLISHFEKPGWFPIDDAVGYIRVPFERELTTGIPPCDLVVATYWREIYECILRRVAPVVYFEQGDYHLFDWPHVSQREKDYIYRQFQVVPFLYTVSEGAARKIKAVFGREASVIPNAIDHDIFYPAVSPPKGRPISVALIGSRGDAFKRVEDILQAAEFVQAAGFEAQLHWISRDRPDNPVGNLYVNPPQAVIGAALRSADYFVCASTYESFSLPVLEAMACGCAVLTTRNEGVLSYAKEGQNCLFVEMQNPADIANKLLALHANPTLRDRLRTGGLKTAKDFSWARIMPQLIRYYRELARYRIASE